MLRINLLPKYFDEKRKVRNAIIAFGLLFAVVVVGMLAWWMQLRGKEQQLTAQLQDATRRAAIVDNLSKQVSAEQAKCPPLENKVKFIDDIKAYNLKAPALYEKLAKYTSAKIYYTSAAIQGDTMTISAHAQNIEDCGRYLMNMYKAQEIFKSVEISNSLPKWSSQSGAMASSGPAGMMMPPDIMGMPGMMPASSQSSTGGKGFDFTVTCKLVEPIQAPTYGGAPEQQNPGTMPGMPPGMPMDPSMMGPPEPMMPPPPGP